MIVIVALYCLRNIHIWEKKKENSCICDSFHLLNEGGCSENIGSKYVNTSEALRTSVENKLN